MMWTTEQNDVLRAYGHEGVTAVQRRLRDECGADHSIHAIEEQACRIRASLKVQTVCTECGAIGVRLNRQTGTCPLCTSRAHVEEARTFNAIVREEAHIAEESPEIEANEREYARLRQENSRICRRYGLKSKTQRQKEAAL